MIQRINRTICLSQTHLSLREEKPGVRQAKPACYDRAAMKFTTPLPKTFAESLKLKKPEPSVLVRVRTHDDKADTLRDQTDDARRAAAQAEIDKKQIGQKLKEKPAVEAPKPHLEFLERWKALEAAVAPIEARAQKEYSAKLGVTEVKPHEVIGHVIAMLPRPRLDLLFQDPRIPALNVALGHRPMQKIVDGNEMLQDLGITHLSFISAKRDFKFSLGINTYRSAQALALYLTVLRAAVDPKARKSASLVADVEVIDAGKELLREVMTHLIEEMQSAHDTFFAVGDRQAVGEQFRVDRAKKTGRPLPAPVKPPPVKPSLGARKA
jgi:hypothetical protein